MRRLLSSIVLWTLVVFVPAPVTGQITDYAGVLGDQEYLNFLNAGEHVASDWTSNGQRVYVGPYAGRFETGGVTSPTFSIVCIDFDTYAGDQWVNVTSLADAGNDADLSETRLAGSSGSLLKYRQAAFLASLFDEDYGAERRTAWSGIHAAIWSLMTGRSIGLDSGLASAAFANDLLDQLALSNDPGSYAADGWYVLSGVDGRHQEMLVRGPVSTVPEPSTYLLMATGLLFLFAFGRRRTRELREH